MFILMKSDKHLLKTGNRKDIYKFETGVDTIKFLIPQMYEDVDLSTLRCVVQCLLPGGTSGLYKNCTYDEELYKDMLTVTLPITNSLTMTQGVLTFWLMFIKPDDDTTAIANYVLKTDSVNVNVIDNGSLDSQSETDFDDIWKHSNIDEVKTDVVTLTETKADGIELSEEGEVVIKAGENVLGAVALPEEVIWEEWN